ncbi:hypothetical protein [Streptomyces sp. NRRL WC-3549]|nr:hypothetical protein [Streptomyces sp. NRRL WC-3549]
MAAKPNYPTTYLGQLTEPFRSSGACTAEPSQPDLLYRPPDETAAT